MLPLSSSSSVRHGRRPHRFSRQEQPRPLRLDSRTSWKHWSTRWWPGRNVPRSPAERCHQNHLAKMKRYNFTVGQTKCWFRGLVCRPISHGNLYQYFQILFKRQHMCCTQVQTILIFNEIYSSVIAGLQGEIPLKNSVHSEYL